MKQRGHVALQHRGLRDDPEDNEFVDAGSIRPDQRARIKGSVIVGHRTRESFIKAVGEPSHRRANGDMYEPAPIQPGYTAAEAVAGLRAAYGVTLATDAEIRQATRTGREQ